MKSHCSLFYMSQRLDVDMSSHNVQLIPSVRHQGASGNQSTEDLIKQPDFSDKIKQLLGSLQQTQTQNPGGPPPGNLSL